MNQFGPVILVKTNLNAIYSTKASISFIHHVTVVLKRSVKFNSGVVNSTAYYVI